jgi:hypothetical protein
MAIAAQMLSAAAPSNNGLHGDLLHERGQCGRSGHRRQGNVAVTGQYYGSVTLAVAL